MDRVGTEVVSHVDRVGTKVLPHVSSVGTKVVPHVDRVGTKVVTHVDHVGTKVVLHMSSVLGRQEHSILWASNVPFVLCQGLSFALLSTFSNHLTIDKVSDYY